MNLTKREFMQVLGAASAAGLGLGRFADASAQTAAEGLYDLPRFGNVSFLHMTDCHAQLKPIYFREPSVNLGVADMKGRLPHLVGEQLLKAVGVKGGTPTAHALTYLDFDQAAQRYGKVGGFAHLATLAALRTCRNSRLERFIYQPLLNYQKQKSPAEPGQGPITC